VAPQRSGSSTTTTPQVIQPPSPWPLGPGSSLNGTPNAGSHASPTRGAHNLWGFDLCQVPRGVARPTESPHALRSRRALAKVAKIGVRCSFHKSERSSSLLHALRWNIVTHLLERGLDVRKIQKQLGQGEIKTTMFHELAHQLHPLRWTGTTRCWHQPEVVWINPPPPENDAKPATLVMAA